ncbi:recombinase family protein [Hydrogenophaga crocea]|uniref:Recombinase family protein n=1 Tax=Hydrogenophaga crocea TaxID=2716225 RepID=A0A6G8IIV8_9BURK|nr:recombinase family protein [Hydrogenophaga crocea]QIM53162.1 recombinase family protein [Hydrogenophaga crocea]
MQHDDPPPPQKWTPAAAYVRMSTEHQQYSTHNQHDKILAYAHHRGLRVVRTFADEGKSGLRIDGRDALKALINTVESGTADFKVILVYDVSRWGRFQDADESAYYEYICKRAGIQVVYCAEQFENDGSPVSTIVKGVKRAMAGEYSRELSSKVFAGQCRLIELGYRQGGTAGYGLRRVLLDQSGKAKGELSRGEHKSLQTDRVVLRPGPQTEVDVVKRIYTWFIEHGLTEREIANRLNSAGVAAEGGGSWSRGQVHGVLTNEKYIGNNLFNRTSFKLKKLHVVNAPEMWIRKEGAFESLVDKETFYTAQGIIRGRYRRYSDEELLERLRALFQQKGYLSGFVINETDGMPPASAYSSRFGSLVRAYSLVGFQPLRDYRYLEINKVLRRLHPQVVEQTTQMIESLHGRVVRDSCTDLLAINGEFTLSMVLSRCESTQNGKHSWMVRLDTGLDPDITVAVRLNSTNEQPLDYYLLPRLDFSGHKLRFADQNRFELEGYRFDNLDYLWQMGAQIHLRKLA